MLRAIEEARRQILLEMYWFGSDTLGRRFAEALSKAAQRGVEVLVIYDSIGSWEADTGMFEQMEEQGVRVIEFNPVMPWRRRFRLDRLSRRDHRKILVVDACRGFTGGINIGNEWLPDSEGGAGFRDDMVCIEGPAVLGLMNCFFRTWSAQQGEALERSLLAGASPLPPAPAGTQEVRVLGEARFRKRREIVAAYLRNIYRATKRVWITNSYFVPDRSVVRALRLAALRGVDVRVLLPGVSDIAIVRHAGRAMYQRLLRAGVRIFELSGTVLHAKTAVIDGRWSTIGTFNLDYRSLRWNLEVNVAVQDTGFASEMEESFSRDLEQSVEIDLKGFAARPWSDRFWEALFYPVRRLL